MPVQINETERKAIEILFQKIKDALAIKKIVLFGSRARGEAEEYSDIDLLFLSEKPKTSSDRNLLSDYSAEVNVEYGVALSCIYYNEQDWENDDVINPLLKENVAREGIELVL